MAVFIEHWHEEYDSHYQLLLIVDLTVDVEVVMEVIQVFKKWRASSDSGKFGHA